MTTLPRCTLAAALACLALPLIAQTLPSGPVQIHVDLAHSLGPYKPITAWFGYDEANYTTMPHGRELLRKLHDLSPGPVTIRAHHLLTSGDGVPELKWSSTNVFTLGPDGKPIYDFTIADRIFDAFRDAGVRPMVEFGFMPRDLTTGTEAYQVHYPGRTTSGSSNGTPKDYAVWAELIRRYTAHLVERYGAEQAATWYWEVWNEPDIDYWHGTPEEYFKLYDYTVAAVRQVLPSAKVGGPATTGPASASASSFLDRFLDHCAHDRSAADGRGIPLDFISFHPKGSPQLVDGHVRMGLASELNATADGFSIVARHAEYRHTPIILSEADPEGCAACSAKVNPANAYRNGPLYPAYTAAAIKALFDLQDRAGVNLISMLTWSFEFEGKDFFEGFRSLATNGVDKPILNLFRMAGLLSGDRVATTSTAQVALADILKSGVRQAPDIDAFATRGDHEAAILLWNYRDDDVPAPGAQVRIDVVDLPAGVHRVLLEHFRIDATHSNAYTVWKAMGSPQQPTPEQFTALQTAGQLQLLRSPEWMEVHDGKVTLATDLPRQATSLLRLTW